MSMVIQMFKIFEASPSGLRSLPPARGSCAPAPCAAHHQSQTPPVYQHQMIAVDHLLGDGGGDGGDDGGGDGDGVVVVDAHLHWTLWYEVAEMALRKLLAVRRDQRMLVFPVTKIMFSVGHFSFSCHDAIRRWWWNYNHYQICGWHETQNL